MQNFKETGSTIKQPLSGRPRTSRDPENVKSVRASVREQPGLSTQKQSSILNVLRTSSNRITHRLIFTTVQKPTWDNMSHLRLIMFSMRNFWISKGDDINWPTRSPDLSPMDFFLWEYLKIKVFKSNPELKEYICEEI